MDQPWRHNPAFTTRPCENSLTGRDLFFPLGIVFAFPVFGGEFFIGKLTGLRVGMDNGLGAIGDVAEMAEQGALVATEDRLIQLGGSLARTASKKFDR